MKAFVPIMIFAFAVGFLCSCDDAMVSRTTVRLVDGWSFALSDTAFAYEEDFDDSQWRVVRLPHDWSIEGSFSEEHPTSVQEGALPAGVGWYRKKINISEKDLCGRVLLQLDGVYMNATVFVNGIKEGRRPNGYVSVCYDITSDLREGENLIAVKAENDVQPNSRWYTGSGIYRNVWLIKTGRVHVAPWGTTIRTPLVNKSKANIDITTELTNGSDYDFDVDVLTVFRDHKGRQVAADKSTVRIDAEKTNKITQHVRIDNPIFWDIDSPKLYTAETVITRSGIEQDRYSTKFGIRSFYFDESVGFIFNDRYLKLNGVCMHHDLGCLGAAVNKRAIERQLLILKDMGCNAILTAHNPPAPEVLQICDSLGLLVVLETFDCWKQSKTDNDYSVFFDEWAERDLSDIIRRDRNHPSIIAWSVGNEVREQWEEASDPADDGVAICRRLSDVAHRLDPTRPVTVGCNYVRPDNRVFCANSLDLVGLNYNNENIDTVRSFFRGKPLMLTETNSALMTRGYYRMPSTELYIMPDDGKRITGQKVNYQCSSYDNCHKPGGSTHERTIIQVAENQSICGQFVWSGFDYLGEPFPFEWPVRSSYFGIVDIAGFPKDVYYLYQSEWQHETTVLYLFPHWNWKQGEEVDVWCYFNNADEVELFVNDHSKGVCKKTPNRRHAIWRVVYEPGTCRVVSRKDKKVVAERVISTAERSARLRLKADRTKIHADGDDLCFVSIEVTDIYGNLCPFAQNEIHFSTEGAACIAAVDNGSPFSHESFHSNCCKAFNGKCLVVLRSNGRTGNARLVATGDNLWSSEITINCLDEATY